MSADRDSVERLIDRLESGSRKLDVPEEAAVLMRVAATYLTALLARCEAAEAEVAHPYREGES